MHVIILLFVIIVSIAHCICSRGMGNVCIHVSVHIFSEFQQKMKMGGLVLEIHVVTFSGDFGKKLPFTNFLEMQKHQVLGDFGEKMNNFGEFLVTFSEFFRQNLGFFS